MYFFLIIGIQLLFLKVFMETDTLLNSIINRLTESITPPVRVNCNLNEGVSIRSLYFAV